MLKLMCDKCGHVVIVSAVNLVNSDGSCPSCGDEFIPSEVGDVEYEPT